MAYESVGSTAHYSISYDKALSKAEGKDRADDLKAVCEKDFALMAGWFGNTPIKYSAPFDVRIENGGGNRASWGTDEKDNLLPISPFLDSGQSLDLLRYLLVAEVTEMFMDSQDEGWFGEGSEGSNGEGLSLFLGKQLLLNIGSSVIPGGIANLWLDSSRPDWVNKSDPSDRSANEKSGCSVLFIWYLNVQLGFDINSIVAAADKTLAGVYKNLTKDTNDPFPDFKKILDDAFPKMPATIPGTNADNPFPLPSSRNLSVKKYIAALPPDQRTGSIRALVVRGGKHTLRSSLNSNRREALL
jgi:hypothetical protein